MIYIAFLAFTILIFIFAFYQLQYFMIFSPTFRRDEEICDECEILSVQTDDGVELEGVVYEPKNSSSTLLVFVGRSHDCVGIIKKLSHAYLDVRVIAFNYRSYGRSEGRANEKNLLSDGLKIAELVQKNYGDFYLLGFSLGSNIASYVATKHKAKALFLIGAFDSIASLAKSKLQGKAFFPLINYSKILRYKFRTSQYVQNIETATYLFVSKSDETTYIQNSRELKKSVKNLVYYKEFDDLTHKELLWNEEVTHKINEAMHETNAI